MKKKIINTTFGEFGHSALVFVVSHNAMHVMLLTSNFLRRLQLFCLFLTISRQMPKFKAFSMLDVYGLQGGKKGPLIFIMRLIIKVRHDAEKSVSSLFVFTLYFCERTVSVMNI